MGIYDREYSQHNFSMPQRGYSGGRMGFAMPPITPAVKWLLIINFAVFLLSEVPAIGQFFAQWFAVLGEKGSLRYSWQLWRCISYQFLHAGFWHIFPNMLGLFFLGPVLERSWGTKKFLEFYLSCGAAGGIFFQLLAYTGVIGSGFMFLVGASGAILGMLAACAILFPHFKVFIFFVIPVSIRVAAIGFTIYYIANIFFQGNNAGGDVAHLGGLAAGAAYVFWMRYQPAQRIKIDWPDRRAQEIRRIHEQVDSILDKVNRNGVGSLSRREKNILKKATKLEQMKN